MWDEFLEERERMVEVQIAARGVKDEIVLQAIRKIPRHMFIPENMKAHAYNDEPLPIGEGQTISQPYIVAYMTEILELSENDVVLEIGTGSGYQTAVLAEIAKQVYSIEILSSLSTRAQAVLKKLGYENIHFKIGDGSHGWKEHAPFNKIMVAAAPSKVPVDLEEQLKVGGRMIIPVGSAFQELVLVFKGEKKSKKKSLIPVRFVPLITKH
jgi:protein-L-isoaspartate(D-aspartate) O-methyltransferase